MKTTKWFKLESDKPVRIGLYQVRANGRKILWGCWKGENFGYINPSAQKAKLYSSHGYNTSFPNEEIEWRGIAEK